jgi:hypothetical protein
MFYHDCGSQLCTNFVLENLHGTLNFQLKNNGNVYAFTTALLGDYIAAKSLGTLYCMNCGVEVEEDEVLAQCSQCNKTDKLSNLSVVTSPDKLFTPTILHPKDCKDTYLEYLEENLKEELRTRTYNNISIILQEVD